MEKITQFKRELAALLDKYGATISADFGEGSDTYGMYDQHMTIYFEGRDEPTHRVSDNWYLDANELKQGE